MLTIVFGLAIGLLMNEAHYTVFQCIYVSGTVTMLAGVYRVIATEGI